MGHPYMYGGYGTGPGTPRHNKHNERELEKGDTTERCPECKGHGMNCQDDGCTLQPHPDIPAEDRCTKCGGSGTDLCPECKGHGITKCRDYKCTERPHKHILKRDRCKECGGTGGC